ncbi:MAG: LysM peptidoglycan-binding domain-containing protein [Chloroflexota bacterium]
MTGIIPSMNRRFFLNLGLLALLMAILALALPAQASPQPQVVQFATPTPGPDGRILYIVQEGDNCIAISLKTGVPLETLYAQNPQLNTDCSNLTVGMQLLLGYGGPAAFSPTPGPSPTATAIPPTPTPFTGTTEVCVFLYNDVNGDALRQETEFGLAGGQVSVTDVNGAYSQAKETTDAVDPDDPTIPVRTCFTGVPGGTYTISVAIPDNYNPTTAIAYQLEVHAGDRAFVDFGAQSNTEQVPGPTTPTNDGGTSSWLGVLGAVLLLGGLGMGWYAIRMRRPPSKFGGGRGMVNR